MADNPGRAIGTPMEPLPPRSRSPRRPRGDRPRAPRRRCLASRTKRKPAPAAATRALCDAAPFTFLSHLLGLLLTDDDLPVVGARVGHRAQTGQQARALEDGKTRASLACRAAPRRSAAHAGRARGAQVTEVSGRAIGVGHAPLIGLPAIGAGNGGVGRPAGAARAAGATIPGSHAVVAGERVAGASPAAGAPAIVRARGVARSGIGSARSRRRSPVASRHAEADRDNDANDTVHREPPFFTLARKATVALPTRPRKGPTTSCTSPTSRSHAIARSWIAAPSDLHVVNEAEAEGHDHHDRVPARC